MLGTKVPAVKTIFEVSRPSIRNLNERAYTQRVHSMTQSLPILSSSVVRIVRKRAHDYFGVMVSARWPETWLEEISLSACGRRREQGR